MRPTAVAGTGTPGVAPESAEVVVVGAGASGAALAWRLASAGVDVVVLDRGGWVDPASYPTTSVDWETHRIRGHSPNPNVRRRSEDYPVADDTTPIKPLVFNGIGGSTIMWSAHHPRFHPSDFRVRTLDGVADDWPLTYEDLEPYYDVNDRIMGISGLTGDPANPPRSPRQTPPVPLGTAGELVAAALDRLGWHWWPSDGAVLTEDYDGRMACNNCGPCELGCTRGAKGSVDITYVPKAMALGARFVAGASVSRVTVDGRGRADGVEYFDPSGRARRVRATSVVLAANGLATPALLLNSASRHHPDGLANSSGQVGRNLMLHPIGAVSGVFDRPMGTFHGPNAFALVCQEFYETDSSRDFVRGYQLQLTRMQGPVVTALGGFQTAVGWGAGHHETFVARFGRMATLAITCEDLPDPDNRVVLDDRLVDRFGVPAPRMIYRVSDNSERMMDHGLARGREIMQEAGAVEVMDRRLLPQAGFHLMGTTRMGTDPSTSVVDAHGRAHDVDNLFVIDGGVFVTAAGVNPTPTIQAIALRTADHMIATRAATEVPV